MAINTEQFATANKATVDSLLSVANTAFATAERFASLNLNTVRSVLEDSAANAQTVMAIKDPKEALSIQAALVKPNVEKAVAYTRSAYEISVQAQEEISKLVQAQFSAFQKSAATLLENAAKSSPVGADVAVAAVKSAIAASNTAFEKMSKAAKQVTETTQANISAATAAASAVSKKSKK